jgi:hypothetical protein
MKGYCPMLGLSEGKQVDFVEVLGYLDARGGRSRRFVKGWLLLRSLLATGPRNLVWHLPEADSGPSNQLLGGSSRDLAHNHDGPRLVTNDTPTLVTCGPS